VPRITRVTTRTGDDGTTALGNGTRVSKDALRIEACGTVDELNSVIGLALSDGLNARIEPALRAIQNELLHLGSDLAMPEPAKATRPVPGIEPRHVDALDRLITDLLAGLPALENFLLPGGSPGAARLHVARCVCRRAERLAVGLSRAEPIGGQVIPYLNRLSDALFVMARVENGSRGAADVLWDSRA
jgi:cob(I)alamin adenosyltransferase